MTPTRANVLYVVSWLLMIVVITAAMVFFGWWGLAVAWCSLGSLAVLATGAYSWENSEMHMAMMVTTGPFAMACVTSDACEHLVQHAKPPETDSSETQTTLD